MWLGINSYQYPVQRNEDQLYQLFWCCTRAIGFGCVFSCVLICFAYVWTSLDTSLKQPGECSKRAAAETTSTSNQFLVQVEIGGSVSCWIYRTKLYQTISNSDHSAHSKEFQCGPKHELSNNFNKSTSISSELWSSKKLDRLTLSVLPVWPRKRSF